MTDDRLQARERAAAESILSNESLTDNLDDKTAQALLDWGLALSKMIVGQTSGLDDQTAEEAMYPALKGVRRLMKSLNRWLPDFSVTEAEANQKIFDKIVADIQVIYGQTFTVPSLEEWHQFLTEQQNVTSDQFVVALRVFIETFVEADDDND